MILVYICYICLAPQQLAAAGIMGAGGLISQTRKLRIGAERMEARRAG